MAVDETVWKRRFLLFSAVRLSGLLLILAGLGIAAGDLVRPGGRPLFGGSLALAGIIETVLVPRLLKRRWEKK